MSMKKSPDNTADKKPLLSMASPVKIDPKTRQIIVEGWITLEMCPLNQTRNDVVRILSSYPKDILPKMLVYDNEQTFTELVQQWLSILSMLKQTEVCLDYKWAKIERTLDLSKAVIDIEWTTITVYGSGPLIEYARLIWSDYTWDIHLPNWILTAKIGHIWDWVFKFSFPDDSYWYRALCNRAKRNRIRIELNTNMRARKFFNDMIAIKKAESTWAKAGKVPENEFLIGNHEWVIKWILKNISEDWMWIFVSKSLASKYQIWEERTFIISFLDSNNSAIKVIIKSITPVEDEHFSIVWCAFDFSKISKDAKLIEEFVGNKNTEIATEIQTKRDKVSLL